MSVSYIALWLSQAPLVLKPDNSEGLFPVQDPWAEEPNVELGPLTPWGAPLQ